MMVMTEKKMKKKRMVMMLILMILQRRKLGYDLRKGDAVLNNFELRKMSGREPEEEDEEVTNCTYLIIVTGTMGDASVYMSGVKF